MTADTAARLQTKFEQCRDRMAAEVVKVVRLMEIDVDLCQKFRRIDQAAASDRERLLMVAVEAARVWYRDPIFVVPATAILTAALVVLARETVIDVR